MKTQDVIDFLKSADSDTLREVVACLGSDYDRGVNRVSTMEAMTIVWNTSRCYQPENLRFP